MEDPNNSKPQEAQENRKRLRNLVAQRVDRVTQELDTRSSHLGLNLELSLRQHPEKDSFIFENSLLSKEVNALHANALLQWFYPLQKDLKNIQSENLNHLDSSRRSYGNFRKKLHAHLREQRRHKVQEPLLDQYFKENQYRELYNIIHNIQSLPNFLLTLEVFKNYSICQIIAHEKGQAFAKSTFSTSGGKSQNKRVPIDDFNKSFQTIKKSKNKNFSKQSFNSDCIELIGNFHAKSFVGSRYNMILAIGRNDFLPPSENEIKRFEDITANLDPVLNAILLRSSQDDRILSIIEALEHIPLPICITDKGDKYLFKNESFETLKENEIKEYDRVEKELRGKNTLKVYFDKNSKEETDLYHFYRVSLLGELLNTLRHELSNPLFGLTLATDILEDERLDPEIQQTIGDIRINGERCQTIIKNFSSLYEDEENFKEFDLIKIIRETIILTKSETKGIRKTIDSKEESLVLYSNPTWISQIIFNLIINSGQALSLHLGDNLREAKISVKIETQANKIFIHIEDNGPGVPDHAVDKLFKPFYTTKETGTGLGLSICKNLIKKLDGDIGYTTSPSGGARFTLNLPFEDL